MVKKLNGKSWNEPITNDHLEVAKEILRKRVLVGLVVEMEESIRRFNLLMGVDDDNDEMNRQCMEEYVTVSEEKRRMKNVGEQEEGVNSPAAMKMHALNKKNANQYPKVGKLPRSMLLCLVPDQLYHVAHVIALPYIHNLYSVFSTAK